MFSIFIVPRSGRRRRNVALNAPERGAGQRNQFPHTRVSHSWTRLDLCRSFLIPPNKCSGKGPYILRPSPRGSIALNLYHCTKTEQPKAIVKEYTHRTKNSGSLSSENSSIHQSISSTHTIVRLCKLKRQFCRFLCNPGT